MLPPIEGATLHVQSLWHCRWRAVYPRDFEGTPTGAFVRVIPGALHL